MTKTVRGVLAMGLVALPCTEGSCTTSPQPDADEPTIPVGFDAYRQWDHWPYLRIGTRAYMTSTFDRAGGNEGGDASHYLRLESDRADALDVRGAGVLYFTRANHWHGSPWHYEADGNDVVVSETCTQDPTACDPNQQDATATLLPSDVFAPPLAYTWPKTRGTDLVGVPIPFARSLAIGHGHTHYGTGYFIYDLFPTGATNVSQPLSTWSPSAPPDDVVSLIDHAGDDIAPTDNVTSLNGDVTVPQHAPITLFDATGPAMLRALKLTLPASEAPALDGARIRITWDGRAQASVDAPVPLFFGTGTLFIRCGATQPPTCDPSNTWLVQALPVNVRTEGGVMTLAVYFPMPFFRSAHVELVGGRAPVPNVSWQVRTQPYRDPTNWVGYFHATYVDQPTPPPMGADLVLLDTTQVEGGGDWCGSFVGTSMIFSDQGVLTTLEGDPRFFFDDSMTPQVQGTGTEEWGGGGDYWQQPAGTTTFPFYGHPVGWSPLAANAAVVQVPPWPAATDLIESTYRYLLADLMPFGRNARIQFEHGGLDDSIEHYQTVAYWYGLPGACLVPTDSVHISDPADEQAHHYVSPLASGVDTVTSRYNWGVDASIPETTDTGRHTTGTTEVSFTIDPNNRGVMLRRKLDYAFPDQLAEVWVASDDGASPTFTDIGPWYTAGSTTGVYSNPPGELDPFQPVVQVSNRQWREDELLIPRALTENHSRIRVRFVYAPPTVPLVPGGTVPSSAWSEYRYTAYVWKLPPPP